MSITPVRFSFIPYALIAALKSKLIFKYQPPAGSAGAAVAKLLNLVTKNQIQADLRAFKAVAETGERPTIKGQPSGRAIHGNGATA